MIRGWFGLKRIAHDLSPELNRRLTETCTEVDRAADNLMKSGKMFGMMPGAPGRRDSMPMMGGPRSYSEFGMFN